MISSPPNAWLIAVAGKSPMSVLVMLLKIGEACRGASTDFDPSPDCALKRRSNVCGVRTFGNGEIRSADLFTAFEIRG